MQNYQVVGMPVMLKYFEQNSFRDHPTRVRTTFPVATHMQTSPLLELTDVL